MQHEAVTNDGIAWRGAAVWYDRGMVPLEPFLRAGRRWLGTRAVGRTLEIAIGTGANLPFYPASIGLTGIDLAPEMLDRARVRAAGLGRDVDLVVADAQELPFGAAVFDTVVCALALCSVPDVPRALGEMARVLRPGGSLLLLDHVISTARGVRVAQRGLERITSRHGEYFTRRQLPLLPAAGFDVAASRRTHLGVVECVQAVRAG